MQFDTDHRLLTARLKTSVENSMIYALLLVSSEIWEYLWKVFLDQWENYWISTETFYMKLHTLQVSTEN